MAKLAIAIMNNKGGASKSTVATQLASAFFLEKGEEVTLVEIDKLNEDNLVFKNTNINTEQVEIENDGVDAPTKIKEILLKDKEENVVIDVGGNLTTELIMKALKKTRMYRKIDLFIIPMSGGGADLKNAINTYNDIKEMSPEAKFIFVLSRVRKKSRVKIQFSEFFNKDISKDHPFIIFEDSDTIDLSRNLGKTVFEIAKDENTKAMLETSFDKALDENNNDEIDALSEMLSIYDESLIYLNTNLLPAFAKIDEALTKD